MARPTPLSGFPEWLPADRIVELAVLDRLRSTFELWGYASIETRSVEPLEQLLRKGEIDKEVYVLRRLHAAHDQAAPDADLALHYDLTVPFARYVLENAGRLHFPFKRYQIQKAWRGERPQDGRFREFTQADVDVVGRGDLPAHYEAELPLLLADALRGLPLPPVRISVNNRKVSQGYFRGLGLTDLAGVLRTVDKLDKVGPDAVHAALVAEVGATDAQADAVLAFAALHATDASIADRIRALGVTDPLLDEGVGELVAVLETAAAYAPGLVAADMRIARGLDYYTGTVYETALVGHEQLGSVCSGGRYDALAVDGDERYPGVGLSVGVTRLVSRLVGQQLVAASRSVPTCVLVALATEDTRADADALARRLRARGISTEVAPAAEKYGRQIRHADRRGIPYVLFPGTDGKPDEVKDIRTGAQVAVDLRTWAPPAEDLHPELRRP